MATVGKAAEALRGIGQQETKGASIDGAPKAQLGVWPCPQATLSSRMPEPVCVARALGAKKWHPLPPNPILLASDYDAPIDTT